MAVGPLGRWLLLDFADAEEAQRTWRLRCVQAEAELRALQGGSSSPRTDGTHGGSPSSSFLSLASAAPGTSEAALARHSSRGSIPEAGADSSSVSPASRTGNVTQPPDTIEDAERLTALAQALALERHLGELADWRAHVGQEVAVAADRVCNLEAQLQHEATCLSQWRAVTNEVADQARLLVQHRRDRHERHDHVCMELDEDTQALLEETRVKDSVKRDLANAEIATQDLHALVGKLEQDMQEVQQERERMWMQREETLIRRCRMTEWHRQCLRDTATARVQISARATALSRLQGEVMRVRSRNERKKRQTQGLLVRCRGELADAVSRADAAGDQLRKVKQQHGRQLKELRAKTSGLQTEVDARLEGIEQSELHLQSLHEEQQEIERCRDQHPGKEHSLHDEAAALHLEATQLGQAAGIREVDEQGFAERLRHEEFLYEDVLRARSVLQQEVAASHEYIQETDVEARSLSAELDHELSSCAVQAAEVARFRCLEDSTRGLEQRRDQLSEECLQLQDGIKQARRGHDRHVADMQEALRRAVRLRTSHAELAESLPQGRGASSGSADQAMGRLNKRVDALLLFLENKEPGARAQADQESHLAMQRGHVALQRRLHADIETAMEASLIAERKAVVVEQQRSLDETRQRTAEQQELRRERRRLEEELARYKRSLEWQRLSAESELEGLRAQIRLVDVETVEGAQSLTADISDLLHKQELERDLLQREVDELSLEVGEQEGEDAAADEEDTIGEEEGDYESAQAMTSPAVLLQKLSERDSELASLKAKREQLQQANVRLKAALVAGLQKKTWPELVPAACEETSTSQKLASHGRDGLVTPLPPTPFAAVIKTSDRVGHSTGVAGNISHERSGSVTGCAGLVSTRQQASAAVAAAAAAAACAEAAASAAAAPPSPSPPSHGRCLSSSAAGTPGQKLSAQPSSPLGRHLSPSNPASSPHNPTVVPNAPIISTMAPSVSLMGSMRSVSTHSLCSSGSVPTLTHTAPGGGISNSVSLPTLQAPKAAGLLTREAKTEDVSRIAELLRVAHRNVRTRPALLQPNTWPSPQAHVFRQAQVPVD